MESEDISEIVEFQQTAEFLTAEELVALRKPKEEPIQASIGIKHSTRSESWIEDKAVECALESYRDSLSQKRGARICDFVRATWNEDLHVVVTSKLKGKFVQHMGHTIDGGIALFPEEALFLLENGCIEIINGKTPMSTEEAYAVMLQGNLSIEKYQVYSHLSQLGFLVVPHHKVLNSKTQVKITNSETTEKRKRKSSPVPEEQSNKRLTFSGAFSEENKDFRTSAALVENESADESNMIISVDEENNTSQPTEENGKQLDESEVCIEEVSHVEKGKTLSEPCNDFQSIENDAESPTDPAVCKAKDHSSDNFIEEMDVDSHSTNNSFHVSAKFGEGQEVEEKETEANNETVVHSEDSQCAIISSSENVNKENSDLLSCTSDSQSFENNTEDNWLCEDGMDDEVTLLEITKKETTPLAVIDLLSDDEEQSNKGEADLSGSDDDIKIIKVCEVSANKENLANVPLNLEKIKFKKIQNCKLEEISNQTTPITLASLPIQFPDLSRKDLVCVPRPPLKYLPFHVLPKKEVYVLDLAKRRNQHSGQSSQQPRLWNSYRDMQDYQRARRQNRHSYRPYSHHQNQDGRSWHHRNFDYHNGGSSREHRQVFNRDYNSMRTPEMNHWNRHDRTFYSRRGSADSVPREQEVEIDLSGTAASQDQKPFTIPPLTFGNSSEQRIFSDNSTNSFRFPQFPNNSLVNSVVSVRPPGLNFGFENHSINTMNSFASSSVPNYPNFFAEVHRTAYSYATSMLSSMFGPPFSSNNVPHFLSPQPERSNHAFSLMPPAQFNGSPSYSSNINNLPVPNRDHFLLQNGRQHFNDYRRPQRGNSFPCRYRNVDNKKSWDDVTNTLEEENRASDDDTSDIEEIPINLNEFLWKPNNMCPLVKGGVKHNVSDVLKPLRSVQMAKLTDKNNKNLKYFLGSSMLEIIYDVYLPGTNFKKSCPGVPKYRVIVVRASDLIPRYSEIAVLHRKWSDNVILQIAVVDSNNIDFCSFNSVYLPVLEPLEE